MKLSYTMCCALKIITQGDVYYDTLAVAVITGGRGTISWSTYDALVRRGLVKTDYEHPISEKGTWFNRKIKLPRALPVVLTEAGKELV